MRPRHAALPLVLLAACTQQPTPTPTGVAPASSQGVASAAEGMCAEHGVLEVVCTKCKPQLVAVFQAKGDWCAEHDFPESFCPICHPERGGKPPGDVGADGAPPNGTKIRFKRQDVAERAGIETAPAEVGRTSEEIVATARLRYDATKVAQLNARAPGVVRSLLVDVGAEVRTGDRLVVIDSADVGAMRARLAAARTAVEVAREEHDRKKTLAADGIAAQKDVSLARNELARAESDRAALSASLSALGAQRGGAGSYALVAPIGGVVTQRGATLGQQVAPDEQLVEIVDTSRMWAELDVPEGALARVSVGQRVALTFDSLPDRRFEGRIDYLAPIIDRHTRTARARVPLDNPDGNLRAEMFGQAHIAVSAPRPSVLVPELCVQRAKNVHVAFVKLSDVEFELRRLTLGTRHDGRVEVVSGLEAGEQVVTTGSFLLKTETLKDGIGAGCCEVD